MAEPTDPREPRIPKESPPFETDGKWTRTWIMYFESLFTLSVKEALRQAKEAIAAANPLKSKGDLMTFDKAVTKLPVGTDGQVLTADSTDAKGIKWATATSGSGTVTHTGGPLTADQPVFGAGSADIKVGTKSGNTNKLATVTGSLTPGHALTTDASGNIVDAGAAPGTGTVTSVALTVPAEFSVSGSPVTTSGTLAVSKATQSANTVFAGPTTGSAAAPTFRAVAPADLPLASSSAFGAVKVDGTTITAASGVISSVGGGGGGSLILLESHTASSSASLNFATRNAPGQSGNTFQSDYDEYAIEFVNLIPATNSVTALVRFSTNAGSSYDSAANYSSVGVYGYTGGSGVPGSASDSATGVVLHDTISNDSHFGICASSRFFSPRSTALYKFMTGDSVIYNASLSKIVLLNWSGAYKVTTVVDTFQFVFSSGNIASGIVRVYGIAK